MKILSFLASLLFASSVFAARVEVDIAGMSCGMCANAITDELKKTDKVENIDVQVGKARFLEIKGKKLSDSEIRAAVKKAGDQYQAMKIIRK